MNTDMQKALVNLIDETLGEIEELKKSDRFSASEVKLGDSKSGIKDMDKDGKLGKEEEKDEDEKEEKDEDEKEVQKAEDKKNEEDEEDEEDEDEKDEDEDEKEEEKKSGNFAKLEDRMKKMESMMKKMETYMKKSVEGVSEKEEFSKSEEDKKEETLEKSTLNRLSSLEKSLENISSMIKEIADAPAPSKSVSYRNVQPLNKSGDASESLTKSDVVNKLFELKKSGGNVDSLDIAGAELANASDLVKIANKYNIK